ncbi:hypothetical protein EMIHUDRAFT_212381 [Emiliania huxleyi CCMP1516]|uniref:Uncharacterized protein n=2 Tax=Emiliania huxleyi TaxID=2903 RepID=A0A0D3IRH0_EMIH1|nr:hypothetical protein EMIHUDRAFT_212381 [Emiliania huxleyi CCMP1516]EOD13855.1 hypothetical protein EMIHUDRAFT_212381 [Emiliania huxleyi CCMP1516]|eukprot:XP_005766284.1 hypothetical protein EMIHUDRAFT_212381 [Emiliania huxleyi CCMP1516]
MGADTLGTGVPEYVAPARPVGGGGEVAAKPCGWNDAFHAAFHGDHSALRALGAEALEADTTGLRPIHLAAMRGKCDCAEAVDCHGRTPLMFAASGGDADMIHLLLGKGAAIDAQSKDGKTALHWAVVAHKLAAVDALVACGAALDVRQDPPDEPLRPGKDELGATAQELATRPNERDPLRRHVATFLGAAAEAHAAGNPPPSMPEPAWLAHAAAVVANDGGDTSTGEEEGAASCKQDEGRVASSASAPAKATDEQECAPQPAEAPSAMSALSDDELKEMLLQAKESEGTAGGLDELD